MAELDFLRPTHRHRVMDLVHDAGVDVSDWANYKRGPERAAANPRYCYQWSFVQEGQVVVLNIWGQFIRKHRDQYSLEDNLRDDAEFYASSKTKRLWQRRAQKFDEAVRLAARRRLPVRAIICAGKVRQERRLDARASQVKARMLDPVPWSVTSYDNETGDFTLTRGVRPVQLVDQFSADGAAESPTETKDVNGKAFVRNPVVRSKALRRANGKCDWCREPGFATAGGSVFLETHHVIPLSEGGPDTVKNVAVLCPNHHREAHYGAARDAIRTALLAKLRNVR